MKMNTRSRAQMQSPKAPTKHVTPEMQGSNGVRAKKSTTSHRTAIKERKLALQQDVDKLKKKLRQEEDINRALKRAFSRPLGTLPRLPPYLPAYALELLAEVAVLEEEVMRLEEQVVHFRQDLYQEAVHISTSKRKIGSSSNSCNAGPATNLNPGKLKCSTQMAGSSIPLKLRHLRSLSEGTCREDHVSRTNSKGRIATKSPGIKAPVKRQPVENCTAEKHLEPQELQAQCTVKSQGENAESRNHKVSVDSRIGDDNPNKVSEDILKCLSSILIRKSSTRNRGTIESFPYLSSVKSHNDSEETEFQDPYCICLEHDKRDIGPYKNMHSIEGGSVNPKRTANHLFLEQRLKLLHGKLASIKLKNLTHQEKLAFWINIYNSCMMNAYIEYGIPEAAHTVVALMQKAMVNVGGHLLNAMTIEHFILRLPYHSKYTLQKGMKNDEMTARSIFGLELSEPLVTFALSCGSWSSPAVRVYTASGVENELEVAKREYLQAAVGISSMRFVIPKLLDWYLLDFAKNLDSLLDWICLQLPSELGKQAIMSLEKGKSKPLSQFVQVMPYDFSFRYILCT